MLRCPINRLLVTIDRKYQDTQGNLFIDTTFQPEEYATLKGKIVSIPDRVEHEYYKGSIEQLARVGDEVWFSYSVVYDYLVYRNGETPVYRNLVPYEGEEYWKVNYEEVFCVVRNGKILMPTQHVLLAPIEDNGSDKLESGLTSIIKKSIFEDRAQVVAMPASSVSCEVGDIIPIEPEFVQKYIIFDKPYYIIPARRLIAKF